MYNTLQYMHWIENCYTGGAGRSQHTNEKEKGIKIQQKSKGSNNRSPGNLARFGESFGVAMSWDCFALIWVNMTSIELYIDMRHSQTVHTYIIFVMLLTSYLRYLAKQLARSVASLCFLAL